MVTEIQHFLPGKELRSLQQVCWMKGLGGEGEGVERNGERRGRELSDLILVMRPTITYHPFLLSHLL